MSKRRELAYQVPFVLVLMWVLLSSAIFRIRHPWATETQILIHTWDVLTFRNINED
jgi:hypothetical protein